MAVQSVKAKIKDSPSSPLRKGLPLLSPLPLINYLGIREAAARATNSPDFVLVFCMPSSWMKVASGESRLSLKKQKGSRPPCLQRKA